MNLVDPTSLEVRDDFVGNWIQLYSKISIQVNKRIKDLNSEQIEEILTEICKLDQRKMFCKSLWILFQVIFFAKGNDLKS